MDVQYQIKQIEYIALDSYNCSWLVSVPFHICQHEGVDVGMILSEPKFLKFIDNQ